jgi:uncharacterized protein with GYD domain
MATYATLIKFTAEGLRRIGNFEKAYKRGTQMTAEMGIKHIRAYGMLGPYDLMLIYEASDEKVAAGVCVSMATELGGETETWTIIPMEEFVKLAASIKG